MPIKFNISSFLLALVLFATACSKTGDMNETICIQKHSGKIRIINNTKEPVYYFIIDNNSAALIYWVASCTSSDNVSQTKWLSLDSLRLVNNANEILVYYWHCSNGKASTIKFITLSASPNQSICKNWN